MYRRLHLRFPAGMLVMLALLLASCGTRAPRYDYRQLAKAAVRLDMDIDAKDNHRLYIEVADWIGTPYRHGGTTRKGTDCSGFTSAVYKKVYRQKLPESSQTQPQGRRSGVLPQRTQETESHPCGHLPERRTVRTRQYQPGSHCQPAGRRLLPPLLDAGRTGERHLTTTIHKHNRQ